MKSQLILHYFGLPFISLIFLSFWFVTAPTSYSLPFFFYKILPSVPPWSVLASVRSKRHKSCFISPYRREHRIISKSMQLAHKNTHSTLQCGPSRAANVCNLALDFDVTESFHYITKVVGRGRKKRRAFLDYYSSWREASGLADQSSLPNHRSSLHHITYFLLIKLLISIYHLLIISTTQ